MSARLSSRALASALACEELNLDVLDAMLQTMTPREIAAIVESAPTSASARRLWFLYEWLTGDELDVSELKGRLEFVPLLDAETHVALKDGVPSPRHRVIDNLPGTRRFCPLVRWTPALRLSASKALDSRAREILWDAPSDEIGRVGEWLQRREARASFALERLAPSISREARWAGAIGQAGIRSLTPAEIDRLHELCRDDTRRARATRGRRIAPWATPSDGDSVLRGIVDYTERALRGSIDPVIVAAASAFGFAQLQPSRPGLGLIHRWLVHYVLDAGGYRPEAAVLPISAAFHRAGDRYGRLVTPGTANGSPYFDATSHAEFLYDCVEQAVEYDVHLAVRAFEPLAAPHAR
jgi:hypothetical protein